MGTYNQALGAMTPAARKAAVLAQFARLFGDSRFLRPVDYFDMDWVGEPWSRGGPTGAVRSGALIAYGPALRAPVGRIHWAGTETAEYWAGLHGRGGALGRAGRRRGSRLG